MLSCIFKKLVMANVPFLHFFSKMSWKQTLINKFQAYKPHDMQETKDKETILKYLNDFDNLLTRDNEYAHFTSSSWIVNPSRTKVLLIYHNIYDAWTWTGGHADGDEDFLAVAMREAKEETNVDVKPLSNDFAIIDILPVWGHVKNGKWVSTHHHLNVAYLMEADDSQEVQIKEDENSGVKWVPVEDVLKTCREVEMHYVYKKLMERTKDFPPSK
ncbi:hydrolase, NUDIX family protein [Tritrichomonas foetus]|uniref:Hydrolase, NUDIX family protein n=1 Tax=Tritrichomonas foetus TaxID=1144522 RepID=A0A1J4JE59_9EUKA|nr:hydrolase, NUDIX family protein [Tritrichomonas foetus]|eukprot:OHS97442.1 hydrolase, NUDIX family protein [Tritrichomonas foetus]